MIQAVKKVVLKIEIIHYREEFPDKLQYFTLNPEFVLINFF
jgi:hypothetical protein